MKRPDRGVERSPESRARESAARADRLARQGAGNGSLLQRAGGQIWRLLSSPEELALLILFLALAGFGVDWLLRIVRGW